MIPRLSNKDASALLPEFISGLSLAASSYAISPIIHSLFQVELLLSRDLDSRINEREVAAVSEFLASEKHFHVMRDHPAHSAPIMGGLWAARPVGVRGKLNSSFKQLFKVTTFTAMYLTSFVAILYFAHSFSVKL